MTALIVADHPDTLQALVEALHSVGAQRVLSPVDLPAAIRMSADYGAAIDLFVAAIADSASAAETANVLLGQRPGLRVLLITDRHTPGVPHDVPLGQRQKPLDLAGFTWMVRAAAAPAPPAVASR
jgi:hypothetical protein